MKITFYVEPTGFIPDNALMSSPAWNTYGGLRYEDNTALWSGCIDAPGLIPSGSVKAQDFRQDYPCSGHVAVVSPGIRRVRAYGVTA